MARSPFLVFPEELWLIIIGYTKEYITAQDLITAIPEFNHIFYPHLKKLAFVQTSPRVFEYQPSAEHRHIPCSVNKNWCDYVNQFLEQSPLKRSFEISGGTWIKRVVQQNTFLYFMRPEEEIPQKLSQSKDVWRFYETVKSNSNQSSHLLTINLSRTCLRRSFTSSYLTEACATLFWEFGVRMHILSLEFDDIDKPNILQVMNLLHYTPNVRKLAIGFNCNDVICIEQINKFPSLPGLEHLEILSRKYQDSILSYFINGDYFRNGNIKALKLVERNYFHITMEYHITTKFFRKTVRSFRYFLRRQKIKSVTFTPYSQTISTITDFISEENSMAEEMIIEECLVYSGVQPKQNLNNVKYLKFTDTSFKRFEFVKAFPTLQHLHICCGNGNKSEMLNNEEIKKQEKFTWLLSNYLYKEKVPNQISIWKELPSLMYLTVKTSGVFSKHFIREYKNKSVVFKSRMQSVDLV